MKLSLRTLTAAAALVGMAASAHAVPFLTVSDGATTISLTDNGSGDIAPGSGAVSWAGAIGNWSFTIASGFVGGSSANPDLHLSVIAQSTQGGSLTVAFGDVFGPSIGGTVAGVGGFLAQGALITYNTFADATLLSTQSFVGAGAFSGTTQGGFVNSPSYTLSQQIQLVHTGAGVSSADAGLHVPDSASTSILLGCSLLGLAALGRRRIQNA